MLKEEEVVVYFYFEFQHVCAIVFKKSNNINILNDAQKVVKGYNFVEDIQSHEWLSKVMATDFHAVSQLTQQ